MNVRTSIISLIIITLFSSIIQAQETHLKQTQKHWGTIEYLHWWIDNGPINTPLITTGSITNNFNPGALGQPSTQIIYGPGSGSNNSVDFGGFNGARLTLGTWLEQTPNYGLETIGFGLKKNTAFFNASSDANGSPLIARPVIMAGQQRGFLTSIPGFLSGSTTVDSNSQLWGVEVNSLLKADSLDQHQIKVTGLAGFRYLDLNEGLKISDYVTALISNTYTFNGIPVTAGQSTIDFDAYTTHNHFYGLQLGAQTSAQYQHVTLKAITKIALGSNREIVTINGETSLYASNGALLNTAVGGVEAVSSNIGRYTHNQFSVVPELQAQLGYQLTETLRPYIAYNLLYIKNVARPGNQIDPNIHSTEIPTDNSYTGPSPNSKPYLSQSSYLAQGINVGVSAVF